MSRTTRTLPRCSRRTWTTWVFIRARTRSLCPPVGHAAQLGDRVDHWHVAPTPGPRGSSAATLAAQLRSHTRAVPVITEYPDVAAAFAGAQKSAEADDRILAFGSFLTVADVMRAIRARPAVGAA